LVRRGGEACVAATSPTTSGSKKSSPFFDEVPEELTRLVVINHGSKRDGKLEVLSVSARLP
jgi:hypothetical protein